MGKTRSKNRDRIRSAPVAIRILRPGEGPDKGAVSKATFAKYAASVREELAKSTERRAAETTNGH